MLQSHNHGFPANKNSGSCSENELFSVGWSRFNCFNYLSRVHNVWKSNYYSYKLVRAGLHPYVGYFYTVEPF